MQFQVTAVHLGFFNMLEWVVLSIVLLVLICMFHGCFF